jgi:Carboxypeptidase regulatory-like domain
MSRRRLFAHVFGICLLLSALIFFLNPCGGFAQDASTGAIRGTVLDPDSGLVAGATVAIVNTATGQRYVATTDANGHFAADLLPPGDYSARVEIQGFSPQVAPQEHLEVGGTLQLQFRLTLAGAKEAVTVSGAPPLVETQPSSVSAVIDEQAIIGLPLNGRRFTDLSLLAPGVTQDPRGLTSSSNGDLAFGGIRGFELPGRWRGQQQRILRAGTRALPRTVPVLE